MAGSGWAWARLCQQPTSTEPDYIHTNCASFLKYNLCGPLPVLHPEVEHPWLALHNVSGGREDGAERGGRGGRRRGGRRR